MSMFSKSFGTTRLALLDMGGGAVVEDEVEDGGEADLADAAAQSDEIDTTLNAVDDGGNDINELNGIADTLEDTEEDGGASPGMIQMAEVAVEHRLLNLTKSKILMKKRILPATEKFVGLKSRKENTRIAVEGIRDWAKKAGETIMEWINKIVEFFKNLFNFSKKGLEKTEVKLIKLKEEIKSGGATSSGESSGGGGGGAPRLGGPAVPLRLEYASKVQIENKVSAPLLLTGSARVEALMNDTSVIIMGFTGVIKEAKPMELAELYGDFDEAAMVNGVSRESNDVEDAVIKRETPHGVTDVEAKGEEGPGRLKRANDYIRAKCKAIVDAIRSFGSKKKDLGNGIAAVTKPEKLPGNALITITGPVSPEADLTSGLGATKIDIESEDGTATLTDLKVEPCKNEAEAIGVIDKLLGLITRAKNFLKNSVTSADATKANGEALKKLTIGERLQRAKHKVFSFFRSINSAASRCYNVVIRYVTGFISSAAGAIHVMCGKVGHSSGEASKKYAAKAGNASGRAEGAFA